ncbi:glutamate-1-semialdehyde 2,1-aminomutase [Hyphobacterium sp. CCMP332]|nr:glutamate-1-semialdehyde 2,1-aminomutase [Hyphobacterium sp. CCMP332]
MDISKSKELFQKAQNHIPGGVNSPVRAFKSVGGQPIFFRKAKGAILEDVNGNEYIDYISSWGPMILGHAQPEVVQAIQKAVENSTSFGAPTSAEIDLAELVCKMAPGIDKVRMVNSGTEACMSAIRLARGFTKKDKIIKFEGCYHGHADSFLIKAGSGASTLGIPNSPGVTKGVAEDTLTCSFNNVEQVEEIFSQNPNQIAALIIEPVPGNMGCIIPQEGFLQKVKTICHANDALLIFDEVMTGFRLAPGGVQELFGITADLVTYGKVIGGGMPVGAYGGSAEIMDYVAPDGPVYQAGTLSGNPVAMASGIATLEFLLDNPEIYLSLNAKALMLKNGISEILETKNADFRINQLGSMLSVHFTNEDVLDFDSAAKGNNETFKRFFHHMLNNGIYLPPSAFESWFLNDALSEIHIRKTLDAVERFDI